MVLKQTALTLSKIENDPFGENGYFRFCAIFIQMAISWSILPKKPHFGHKSSVFLIQNLKKVTQNQAEQYDFGEKIEKRAI